MACSMEKFFKKYFVENIHRKLFAVLSAVVIWLTINNSITSTRVFTRVPVRIVNLPQDKTIRGLMPNGTLDRKLTITLTGTRRIVEKMDTSDIEVVIDAADKGDEWVAQVSKKNLVSLNPDIELLHNISNVSHNELVIRLCPLITEKVPVWVLPPRGEPPEGYQVLDVWPQKLFHVISGPEEEVKLLQQEGLELSLDISSITKEELDLLRSDDFGDTDEVSFFVPESWKKVAIPFLNSAAQVINSQEAKYLRIDFLREELLPLEGMIPVRIFYPPNLSDEMNSQTLRIIPTDSVSVSKGMAVCTVPLYVAGVSKLFLDLVKNHLEILLVPIKRNNTLQFRWQVQFIDVAHLEEAYVMLTLAGGQDTEHTNPNTPQLWKQHIFQREHYLDARFREYMDQFKLFLGKNKPFQLSAEADKEGNVRVTIVSDAA